MKKIEKRALLCLLLAAALLLGSGLFVFRFVKNGGRWVSFAANRHLYNRQGQLSVGRVLDRDGDVLSWTEEDGARRWYDNSTVRKATLHAVGDAQGNIGTGALVAFADQLSGYNLLTGAYSPLGAGNDLYLTLDARYNYIAYEALAGRKGAVGVYNYETGEVLCMVSTPAFDPLYPPSAEEMEGNDAYDGVYLNRFLSGTFPPGSVYKTVVLSAAIERMPDLFDRTWTCTGSTQVGDGAITCPRAHGEQDISSALANSCNGVFALLADELGEDVLEEYTVRAGLTSSYRVSGLNTAAGSFDFDGLTANELGWAGVGQYNDLANPCALMVYMGAIANGGRAPAGAQDGERPGPAVPARPAPAHQKAGGGGYRRRPGGADGPQCHGSVRRLPLPQHGRVRQERHRRGGGRQGPPRLVRRLPPQPRRPLRLRGAGGERRFRCGRGGLRGGQGAGRGGQRILKAGPRRAAKPCAGGVLIAAPVRCAGARRGSPPPPPAPERARGGRDRRSPPPRSGRRPPPAAPP